MFFPYAPNPNCIQVLNSEPEFMGWIRRRFPEYADRLFLYRHARGTFVVGMHYGPEFIADILILGDTLTFTRKHRAEIEFTLDPPPGQELSAKRLRQAEQAQEAAQDQEDQEWDDEFREIKKGLVKKGVDHPIVSSGTKGM
jgi:hypothetical protein